MSASGSPCYSWRPNPRGEADNHLVELAVAGNARFLVTANLRDPRIVLPETPLEKNDPHGTLSTRLPEDKRQRLREDKTEPSALRDEECSGD